MFHIFVEQSHQKEPLGSKLWPSRDSLVFGILVTRDWFILPSLHIKHWIIKRFVKVLYKHASFAYIPYWFAQLSTEKLKSGIFDRPEIRFLTCVFFHRLIGFPQSSKVRGYAGFAPAKNGRWCGYQLKTSTCGIPARSHRLDCWYEMSNLWSSSNRKHEKNLSHW